LSPDSAIDWAKAALVAKNRLTADDATQVADAFDQRLSAWALELIQLTGRHLHINVWGVY
jgi:hypothetical protein